MEFVEAKNSDKTRNKVMTHNTWKLEKQFYNKHKNNAQGRFCKTTENRVRMLNGCHLVMEVPTITQSKRM